MHPIKAWVWKHVRETCSWRFKSKWRSVEFSSVAIRCKVERKRGETCCCRDKPELGLSSKCGRSAAEGSSIVNVDSVWPNNIQISVPCIPHLEQVHSKLRQNIGRKSGDDMNDFDTNSLTWRMFVSATLDAAVHLGKDHLDQKSSTTNDKTIVRSVTKLDHGPNRDSRNIEDWLAHTSSTKDNIVKTTKQSNYQQQIYAFLDSVLCLGKMNSYPESIDAWKKKIEWFTSTPQYRELDRIDGEPMEFECKNFQGFTTLQILPRSRTWWLKSSVNLGNWQDKIIFMSMYNDIVWWDEENKELSCEFHNNGRICKTILAKTLVVSRAWIRKEMVRIKHVQAEWDDVAEHMLLNFSECGENFPRGFLTVLQARWDLLRRTNQTPWSRPTHFRPMSKRGETVCYVGCSSSSWKRLFGELHSTKNDLRKIKECPDEDFMKTVARRQYFVTLDEAELATLDCLGSCREYTLPRDDELSKIQGWIRGHTKIGSSIGGNSH